MTLFKYVNSQRLDILVNGKIRFTPASELNDPYELTPVVSTIAREQKLEETFSEKLPSEIYQQLKGIVPEATILKAQEYFSAEFSDESSSFYRNVMAFSKLNLKRALRELESGFAHAREKIGILSLSESMNDLLMWAHYADDHQGFVIALDENHASLNSPRGEDDEFYKPRKVQYRRDRPRHILSELDGTQLFLTKSLDWSYEKEWRVLKPIVASDPSSPVAGLFELPSEAIEGIVIGARCSLDHKLKLRQLISERDTYSHLWIKQAVLSTSKYEVDLVDLPGKPLQGTALPDSFNLSIFGDSYDEDKAYIFGEVFKAIAKLKSLWPLNLSTLSQVTLVSSVDSFVRENLKHNPRGTIDYFVECLEAPNKPKISVVLPLSSIENILSEEKSGGTIAATANIRRALAHAHDAAERFSMFGANGMQIRQHSPLSYVRSISVGMWIRFWVEYASVETYSGPTIEQLAEQVSSLEKRTKDAVSLRLNEFDVHKDVNRLLLEVFPIVEDYFVDIAKYLGVNEAARDTNGSFVLHEPLEKIDYIKDAQLALFKLLETYPVWKDDTVFVALDECIEWFLGQVGVAFMKVDEGWYVAVNKVG